ncbi:Uncharacterized protein TCM_031275 [Theobroma cacao]|uniref:Uncharacterized protein n=1 Tax=Theobroma cacao TaxID=3641 RepID=A0A061FE45_THECC|nr:Uncharacterized protein TCM_031275 [Theobroma cacao]
MSSSRQKDSTSNRGRQSSATIPPPKRHDGNQWKGLEKIFPMAFVASRLALWLLNTLTQALQTSGVDLSHASISVQIELGKRSSSRPTASASTLKDREAPTANQGTTRSRVGCGEDSD